MLGFDAQQRAQEALRRIDQTLETDINTESAVQTQAHSFRDAFFGAFQYIERETLQLKALFVQLNRLDINQIQVQSRGRAPFMLSLDPEVAYDTKTGTTQGQTGEGAAQGPVELSARLFAVFAPPYQGLVRYYTIFADGTWKRTTFTFGAGSPQARSALLQRFNLDVLVLEAADLLGHICTLHPTWANLAPTAETLTFEMLRERERIKDHLTGLGVARRPQP